MSPTSHRYRIASAAIALIDASLLWWGLYLLFVPPLYKMIRSHDPFLYYEGHIIVFLSVLLAWFHQQAIRLIFWLCSNTYRWLSALPVLFVTGIEGFMHAFNIPHVEGWWLSFWAFSIVGSGLFLWIKEYSRNLFSKKISDFTKSIRSFNFNVEKS